MIKELFLKKSLEQLQNDAENNNSLRRHLNAMNLVLLGIGCVIGAGIFVLTGSAAAMYAGPAVAVSFAVSALGCMFAGLCYAEFASMIPLSGSAYTYGYATMGEFIAWIIGWDLILEYLFGAATVAVGWSGYVVSFLADFGIIVPTNISQSPFLYSIENGFYSSGAIINFPAMFIVAIVATLLVIGIKESARFNNIIVLIKVVVILLFIGFGISHIDTANWQPFIPERVITPDGVGHFGVWGIITAAAVVFFSFIGFDAVSTASQEAINPKRDMPIGILVSLAVCSVLYIVVSLILTGIVNYKELNVAAPIALAIDKFGTGFWWLSPIIKIGAIAGLSSVVLVLMLAQSRIFYTMSRDGLLWKSFSRVHPKFKTPHITTIITGIAAGLVAGLFPIGLLGELVSIGTLLAFVIVSIGIIVLRAKEPNAPRAFRTPWVPVIPILGALICLGQMVALPRDTWIRLILWMLIGFVIYFTYGRKHSKVQNKNS
jgi:APA family basic amino acid/polyamine antiporter